MANGINWLNWTVKSHLARRSGRKLLQLLLQLPGAQHAGGKDWSRNKWMSSGCWWPFLYFSYCISSGLLIGCHGNGFLLFKTTVASELPINFNQCCYMASTILNNPLPPPSLLQGLLSAAFNTCRTNPIANLFFVFQKTKPNQIKK